MEKSPSETRDQLIGRDHRKETSSDEAKFRKGSRNTGLQNSSIEILNISGLTI